MAYVFVDDEILDHALEGLFADVGGEDDLALEAVEAFAAEDLLAEGVDLFSIDYH